MTYVYYYDENTGLYTGQGIISGNVKSDDDNRIPDNATINPPPVSYVRFDKEVGTWVKNTNEKPAEAPQKETPLQIVDDTTKEKVDAFFEADKMKPVQQEETRQPEQPKRRKRRARPKD